MAPWIYIGTVDLYWGAKGPSDPSNLNNLLWGFGIVVGPWTYSGALDLYWGEGAFGPFNLNSLLWILGLVVGSWTCIKAMRLSAPSNVNSLLRGLDL